MGRKLPSVFNPTADVVFLHDGFSISNRSLVSIRLMTRGSLTVSSSMARLSILAIIYVLAPDSLTRRFIKAIGVVFFIMGGIMIGQLFWTCEPQVKAFVKLFPPEYPPFCVVTRGMVVTQLICE
jgi:hypothetical protein